MKKKRTRPKKTASPDPKLNSNEKENDTSEKTEAETSVSESHARREDCVVVGIGASAGGLEAYKLLLRRMPDDSNLAFVLVQHLDPTHESLMVELLSKYTSMPVLQIEDATPIQPNHVYMIPPNSFVRIKDGGLFLEQPVTQRGVRLPIDFFFRSLAEDRKERSICVVLSGTGSDGADGVRHAKTEGGLTIVQQPESAEYDGMPRAAINTGAVDFVLPIEEMADVIVPYAQHPYVQARPHATLAETSPDHFRAMLALLRAHTDHDFSNYKKGTLTRRIDRRMGIRQISQPADYLKLLREDSDELRNLFKDLLIGVTRFFRDPQAWQDLADVLTRLMLEKQDEEPFRVWVPGCSSGEEAYSLAILAHEQLQRHNRRLDLQVFATDIDSNAIDRARIGVYHENVAKDLADGRIDAFFQREGDKLRVRKKLRETCIFAVQNMLSDPPFSGLDLICCRNLLIYLEADVQRRLFDMMHFALKPGGLLFLGTSESPAKRKNLFEVVSQSSRIYRKVGESKPGSGGFPIDKAKPRAAGASAPSSNGGAAVGTAELSRQTLLEVYAPASVVVNARGLIQYIHGNLSNYLSLPSGEPDLDVHAMADEGLKAKVRSALHQVRSSRETISVVAPRVHRNGKFVAVRIQAYPLPLVRGSGPLYMLSFVDELDTIPIDDSRDESGDGQETHEGSRRDADDAGSERELAIELQATREDLQSTIEELESANEELKASNEEVMSMNEELQSTNEELETSREELQSLNEELSTVNNQLRDKVEELEATTNDLSNLLASTDMATVFLDRDLRIRRFTPATVRLMSLQETDIGRPLSDLAPRVHDPDMVSDAREVLQKLTSVQKEVHNGGGHNYIRRITPFRTADNKIEGVVITFSDVTVLKEAASRLEFRERQQAVIAQLGRAALAGEPIPSLLDRAVREVAETLNVDYCKVLKLIGDQRELLLVAGTGWQQGIVGHATVPNSIDSQAGYTLQTSGPVLVKDMHKEKRFSGPPLLLQHEVVSGMSVIIGPEARPWGVLGVHSRHEIEFTIDDTNFMQAVSNVLWESIERRAAEDKVRQDAIRATVIHEATVMSAETDSFEHALDGCMKIVCRLTECPVGHVYHLGEGGKLVPSGLWQVPDDGSLNEFRELTQQSTFRMGDDTLPGRIAAEGKPISIRDVQQDPGFQRLKGRPDIPIRGAFGFPVQVKGQTVAVLEFFHTQILEPDENLLNTVRILGEQVGRVFERRQADEQVRDRERRLTLVTDAMPALLAYSGRDMVYRFCNKQYEDWFGLKQDQIIGKHLSEVIGPKAFQAVEPYVRRVLTGEYVSFEQLLPYRHGPNRYVHVQYVPDQSSGGDVVGYYAMIEDVSERVWADRARAQLAAIVEHSNDAIIGKDLDGIVTSWNRAAELLYGYTADEMVGQSIAKLIPQDRPNEFSDIMNRLRRGEAIHNHSTLRRCKDGTFRDVSLSISPIRNSQGEIVGASAIARDVTEEKRLQRQLEEARQAAEAASEAKSVFLANMSHEIRTPMTAILGYADILNAQIDDADAKACIRTIRENGAYLCDILNDILDLSKIESGKLTVRHERFSIVEILADIRSLMTIRATEKGLTLAVEFDGNLPMTIDSDRKMVRQILVNLVGNAVKFTQQGGVRIVTRCLPAQELLEISVTDTGIGIAQEQIDALFRPFEQLDNSFTRTAGGSGLGLAISKKLVEMLGGEITVESTPNEGSTFRFTLQTGSLKEADWIAPDPGKLRATMSSVAPEELPRITGRILAVDDRREIRYLVRQIVESAGGRVELAENGEEAIQAWIDRRNSGKEFDAVLMDMQMPVIDGLEATRKLRAEDYRGPVIALTASALRQDRDRCLEAGCDDFVSKPINRELLLGKLSQWIEQKTASRQNDGRAVLCVDDSEDTCRLQKILLETRGYRVETAANGEDALHLLSSFTPDVVLLDLGLEGMTGSELLAQLKTMPELTNCVFICLSGRSEHEIDWREAGFHYFLRKPADTDELERLLRRVTASH